MRLLSVKCPNCAAVLKAPGTALTIACEYCHTTSQISRRTAFLERQIPVPEAPARAGMPLAVQRHSGRWFAAFGVIPLVLGLAITGFVAFKSGAFGGGIRVWHQLGPMTTVDVNADGISDPIGFAMHPMSDDSATTLLAVSGKDGEILWESKSLGSWSNDIASALIINTGRALFLAKETGQLLAFERATGKATWSAQLPEKPRSFCYGDDPLHVLAETADASWLLVDTQDGSMAPVERPSHCVPLAGRRLGAPAAKTESYAPGASVAEIGPMKVEWAFHLPESELGVAFGVRNTGTKVPMVGAYRFADYQPLWASEVPAANPLSADTGTPSGQISAEHVVVAYSVSGAPRISVFRLADGKRLWDAALPGKWTIRGLAITSDMVYASSAGLYGFDLATGKLRFKTAVTSAPSR